MAIPAATNGCEFVVEILPNTPSEIAGEAAVSSGSLQIQGQLLR
jgi:hypothetical protein